MSHPSYLKFHHIAPLLTSAAVTVRREHTVICYMVPINIYTEEKDWEQRRRWEEIASFSGHLPLSFSLGGSKVTYVVKKTEWETAWE